ncbi:hypothetical protein ABZ330_00455 [Streptomyces sp. NPDC006172]|uniref:hypothetical protein n=1 Tax=Streptomyces sp. NPDC006172 TaxID=3154470 RepID=UPI0033EFC20D
MGFWLPGMLITASRLDRDTKQVKDTTARTVTSTTYGNGSSALSTTILGPPSGQLEVTVEARVDHASGTNVLSSFTASGSTSGTLYTPIDAEATQWASTSSAGPMATSQVFSCLPGEVVTITAVHRVTSGTGNMRYRSLKVRQL